MDNVEISIVNTAHHMRVFATYPASVHTNTVAKLVRQKLRELPTPVWSGSVGERIGEYCLGESSEWRRVGSNLTPDSEPTKRRFWNVSIIPA